MKLPRTPAQTVGPYLSLGLAWPDGPLVVAEGTAGGAWIRGRLLDGAGDPIDDGLIETWQPDPAGRWPARSREQAFRGFGRSTTDGTGRWAIHTLKPGRVTDGAAMLAAPHLAVAVFARGLLKPAWTRIYFSDEEAANAEDAILRALEPARRRTLIAQAEPGGYRLDIRLQGADETVFFDV